MQKFLTGFKFAASGLVYLFRTQLNAKVHLAITLAVVVAGFVFGISAVEWCLIVLCIVLVLGAEAFNTALEALADALHPEKHPLVGIAKDVAAGAVLVCAIGAAIVGAIIFLPYLNAQL